MSTEYLLKAAITTGTGRRKLTEVSAYVQNGVIVAPGGGSAVVVVNNTGATIARDALVSVSGVTGGVLEIVLADANVDDLAAHYYMPAALLNGQTGLAYISGLSSATLNTNAGTVDDPVYLSETVGGWTLTAPTAAASIDQIVGRIAVKDASVGQIMWAVQSGDYDIGTNEIQDLAVTLGKWALLARGSIVSGQTAGNVPTALDLSGDGTIPIGDGNDVAAFAFTGDVSLSNAGLTALVADALGADAHGRGVIETDYFNEATVDDLFADSTIDDHKLKSLGTTRYLGGRDIGRGCVGYFYLTGVAADTETVVIDGRTYEFDTAPTSITGDVMVDINADQSADAACTALVAALNADGTRVVDGVVMAGNGNANAGVMFVPIAAGATNYTLVTTCGNGVVSAATLTDAAALTNRDIMAGEYGVTAADVTQLALTEGNSIAIAGFPSTTQPTLTGFTIRTAAGAFKSPASLEATMLQANANFWIVAIDDGGAILANGDLIGFTLTV